MKYEKVSVNLRETSASLRVPGSYPADWFLTLWLLGVALLLMTACRAFPPGPPAPPPLLPTPTPTPRLQFTVSRIPADLGRESLDSYRAKVRLEFTGTLEGQSVSGQVEALDKVIKEPPARHLYLNLTGDIPRSLPGGVSEVFQVEDDLYFKKMGEAVWSQISAQERAIDRLNLFEPERLLVIPDTVSLPPQPEILNGQEVEHYRFSELDLSAPAITFEKAQGDLWLTTPDNILVQYTLSATLKMPLADPTIRLFEEGQLTLSYALNDIDNPLDITLPETIKSETNALASLPQLPDARIITAFPSLLEYTSAISAISATLFYREQLTDLEWSEDNATIFNEKASLTFSKDDQTLSLIITPAGEPETIKILLNVETKQNTGSSSE